MKKIIGFFCGTGYYAEKPEKPEKEDQCLKAIQAAITDETAVFAFDGCQIHGGGVFAHGVKEQAEAFIKKLKEQDGIFQLNLIGHSRGAISAEWVVKLIQADPVLRGKVQVTLDLRDPVPGNLQVTSQVAGNFAASNWVYDLSDCEFVKKVYITLQEKPIIPLAFDALVSKFHPDTNVEIETLPGYHDAQQRSQVSPSFDSREMLKLGNAKTMAILEVDGHELSDENQKLDAVALQGRQIEAYDNLLKWAKSRALPFGERDLHFDGKINANNYDKTHIEVINWRHAKLKQDIPGRILYGTSQSNYNYRKSALEHACDLYMTYDKLLENNKLTDKQKAEFRDEMMRSTQQFLNANINGVEYRLQMTSSLQTRGINNKELAKAINYLCLADYFKELDEAIKSIPQNNALVDNLWALKTVLRDELIIAIESGKSMEQIQQSPPLKMASNTVTFLKNLYSGEHAGLEKGIDLCNQYAKDNIRLGRDWQLGSKIIVGALLTVAAVAAGAVVGAAIGLGVGVFSGAITGLGAFITAFIGAFYGALEGAALAATVSGATVGLGLASYGSHHLFSPSKAEKLVQQISADAAKLRVVPKPN